MADEAPSKMQQKVTESLNDLFEKTLNDRKKHFIKNPDEIPQRDGVGALINKWANVNALVAGAAGLIPGPWGMLAAVPEIITVIRNQTRVSGSLSVEIRENSRGIGLRPPRVGRRTKGTARSARPGALDSSGF